MMTTHLHHPAGHDRHTQLDLRRRPRRLRRSAAMRSLVRETRLSADMFIYPLFVCSGEGQRREVGSMPGVFQLSVDEAVREAAAAQKDGVPGVLLFGLPDDKDTIGSAAYDPEAPVQSAVRAIKQEVPGLLGRVTDVCLCEYTSHGHCGILVDDEITNDTTVEQLVRAALSHAVAGADIVAPSDMMDGRVTGSVMRWTGKVHQVRIMWYAAKYGSAFYGPFRDAAGSTPEFGYRRSHQMDPPNAREALREIELDIKEGAGIVMVKPALAYLDMIARLIEEFRLRSPRLGSAASTR